MRKEKMECLAVNSIRHLISLQWNVKVKNILQDLTSQESDNSSDVPEENICSAQCEINAMQDSSFQLELTSQLNVLAKGHGGWSYQIIYAFAVVKDRAFLVKTSDKLKFLNFLEPDHLDLVEEVTFYCMVLVTPHAEDSTSVKPKLAGIKEGLPTEGQVSVDLECIGHLHNKFDGEIPDFTVDKAKQLISNKGINSVLKTLAMEYLIESIRVKNVTDILEIAVDQDLKVLQKHCFEFLRKCTIQNENFSSSSSTSSDDDYEMTGI